MNLPMNESIQRIINSVEQAIKNACSKNLFDQPWYSPTVSIREKSFEKFYEYNIQYGWTYCDASGCQLQDMYLTRDTDDITINLRRCNGEIYEYLNMQNVEIADVV